MDKNKKIVAIIVVIVIATLSFGVAGGWATNPDKYTKSYEALNDTQVKAMGLVGEARWVVEFNIK